MRTFAHQKRPSRILLDTFRILHILTVLIRASPAKLAMTIATLRVVIPVAYGATKLGLTNIIASRR